MKKRQIGSSGIFVSEMGIGTTKFGRNEAVKYSQKFSLPDEKKISRILKTSSSKGVNLIDTAPAYGSSEQMLGKVLKNWRKDWVLCTKVGESFHQGKSFYDFSKSAIQKSLENSLQKLQTDYLDLVLVHSNGQDEEILPSLEILAQAKKKGMIRLFGMSSKTKTGGIKALKESDVAMVHYNLEYSEQQELLEFAKQEKKGILIKKAFQSGSLFCGSDKKQILKKNIRFILEQAAVSSIIIGTINPLHLQENIALFSA
jgi:aryl-alcohol dehydrogenase-like predicted oxidoreductase